MSRAAAATRLTAFNAVRLAANPLLYLGLGLSTTLVYVTLGYYPWPHALDVHNTTETVAVVVAATMFAVTTFPALREVRYSGVFVAPLGRTGRLLSLLAAAALVTVVCQAAMTAVCHWAAGGGLPGMVSPYARATPFALALVGPAAGVAVAGWTRSYVQLIVPVILAPAYYLYVNTALVSVGPQMVSRVESMATRAVNPFQVMSPQITVLSAYYLGYVLLVLGVFVAVALAARPRRGAARGAAFGAAAVLLAGAVATPAYANTTYGWDRRFPDSALYGGDSTRCEVREAITYCPLPGFEPWVDTWHATLSEPLGFLPEQAQDRFPVVWQDGPGFSRMLNLPPGRGVVVFTGASPDDPFFRSDLRNQAARTVFGLHSDFEGWCWATGQARLPLTYWLATVGADDGEPDPFIGYHLASFGPSAADLEVARALEETPAERVAEVLAGHWEELNAPGTPTTELASLLGLPVTAEAAGVATEAEWREHYPEYVFEPEYDLPEESAPTCG
ncbi:hypothetical protein [Nocardiopsis sp. FIRDI 009]|uniref:hypothetical protein n=1 Tax=Nocardiopsis sp. FIRDI 009 TaxID=714197 RepID=UPI000E24C4E2|nr:hypothetical protein [Nocardiopsis sp. FIRDI 009]